MDGFNRIHAILGASPHCIATHPSDMCVALAALDATVNLDGPSGDAHDALRRFSSAAWRHARHRNESAARRTDHVDRSAGAARSRLPRRIARCAIARAMPLRWCRWRRRSRSTDGTMRDVRLALGGVAHKPWRARLPRRRSWAQAPTPTPSPVRPMRNWRQPCRDRHNGFKIELAKRVIVATLSELRRRRSGDEHHPDRRSSESRR